MIGEVYFFSEEISFELENASRYQKWITDIVSKEKCELKSVNYIFCSDPYLLDINQQYLDHDFYTDIISFPMSEKPDPIEGDIFISIDMVRENAIQNKVEFNNELLRVMAHGILHFLGYKDKNDEESTVMRKKEDEMILLFLKR